MSILVPKCIADRMGRKINECLSFLVVCPSISDMIILSYLVIVSLFYREEGVGTLWRRRRCPSYKYRYRVAWFKWLI